MKFDQKTIEKFKTEKKGNYLINYYIDLTNNDAEDLEDFSKEYKYLEEITAGYEFCREPITDILIIKEKQLYYLGRL